MTPDSAVTADGGGGMDDQGTGVDTGTPDDMGADAAPPDDGGVDAGPETDQGFDAGLAPLGRSASWPASATAASARTGCAVTEPATAGASGAA
ncbi:MAG: hypothetical protein IPG81_12790 [Sandaracinaceae bacterium]|nr:hypothetical protein [Sandaracinaceae bacterium]